MPGEEVVRTLLRPRERSGRTLDQRAAARFPSIATAGFRLIAGLPPRSRMRRYALARSASLGIDAFNRRDLDVVVAGWHSEFRYRPERQWVEAGLVEESYRGLQQYRRYVATVDEVWGGENYLDPLELIDLGDRFLVLAGARMRAQVSGVPLGQEFGLVTTMKDGLPFDLQEHYDHAAALAAVGLPLPA